jgi:hypothetical protein
MPNESTVIRLRNPNLKSFVKSIEESWKLLVRIHKTLGLEDDISLLSCLNHLSYSAPSIAER